MKHKVKCCPDSCTDEVIVLNFGEVGFVITCVHFLRSIGQYIEDLGEEFSCEVDGTRKITWNNWVMLGFGMNAHTSLVQIWTHTCACA